MKTPRLWRNPASTLDFLDVRLAAFLSTLELAAPLPLWRILKIIGLTALAVYASIIALFLFDVDREFNNRTVVVVTATDVAIGAAILFGAVSTWSVIVLVRDLSSCWRSARRSPMAPPHILHHVDDDPDQSLDNLRAYAAARRNEALHDHDIVVNAIHTMSKEIFK